MATSKRPSRKVSTRMMRRTGRIVPVTVLLTFLAWLFFLLFGGVHVVSAQVFSAEPKQVIWKNPVSVLIDATTSGAAEVLASAIVANHRGDVVGERTFGLASEQKLITLDDGAALILTVANYYNPGGKSIMEEGVTPTEVVRAVPEDDSDTPDEEAAPAPQTQKEPGLGPRPLSPEDPIFHRALDLLKAPVKKAA